MTGRRSGERAPATALARQLRVVSLLAVLAMTPVVFYFTTEGTWSLQKQRNDIGWSGGFYMAQAEAVVHGRLDVSRIDLIAECFDWDSLCYGYFGLTPSVVRIPFLGVLRWLDSSLTPLFVGFALLIAYWGALRLLEYSLVEFSLPGAPRALVLGYAIAGALVLGPGGTLLFLTRPAVYEEASAWGVAFFTLAIGRVWAWHKTREFRPLVFATLFAIAGANARLTAVTACGLLGCVVAVLLLSGNKDRDGSATRRCVLAAAACLSLLPALTVAGVLWLKFRTPLPDLRLHQQVPEAPHWRDILQSNGDRTAGLVFAPTELVAYFRPDTVIRRPAWPYFDFRFPKRAPILWVPPLPEGGAYVERFASLTSTMPLAWTVNLFVAIWLSMTAWRWTPARGAPVGTTRLAPLTRDEWVFAAGSLASAGAMAVMTVMTSTITNRYLSDFFPISVVGVALGHRVIVPILDRRPLLGAAAALVALVLIGWSVVVTLSLNTRLVFQ